MLVYIIEEEEEEEGRLTYTIIPSKHENHIYLFFIALGLYCLQTSIQLLLSSVTFF